MCTWPDVEGVRGIAAAAFERRSTKNYIIDGAVRAMDGLFVRLRCPSAREYPCPAAFYSGHKKAFGMNFQVGKLIRYRSNLTAIGNFVVGTEIPQAVRH